MNRPWLLVLACPLALVFACGPDKKPESTTPDEFLKQEKARQAAAKGSTGQGTTAAPRAAAPAPTPPAGKTPVAVTPPPEPPAPEDRAAPIPEAEVQSALGYVRRGQYEQAINQAKTALRRNEKYAPAMVIMARAYYQLNKLEFADAICDIALSIDAASGECYNVKGFVALKNDNDPLALQLFQKATQAKPSFGPGWLNLGHQYLKVKNYPAAVPALERAVELMPTRAEAQLNLGSAYRGANELTKAQNAYFRAAQLRPNYPAVYFNLGILYLDAQNFPGMPRLQALNTAVSYFTKYKHQMTYPAKDDPADAYIKEAQKAYEREQKDQQREAQRRARDAAKKAAPAPAPKPAPGK